LLQAPPGSYQFSVAIQGSSQKDFFKENIEPSQGATRFLDILRATVTDDPARLESLVSDEGCLSSFLKLARNLTPSGKTFDRLEIRSASDSTPVALNPDSRLMISSVLRTKTQYPQYAHSSPGESAQATG
jgi:hypothetical protein